MTSWKEDFPSKYLKAEDINDSVDTVLEKVEHEAIKDMDGEKNRLVAYFKGFEKGLILNVTNCKQMEKITGTEEYENWKGAKVRIMVLPVQFKKEMVNAIRLFPVPEKKGSATISKAMGEGG